jgi:hypothetical protein
MRETLSSALPKRIATDLQPANVKKLASEAQLTLMS